MWKAKSEERFILLDKGRNPGKLPRGSEILDESIRINRSESSPTVVYLVILGLASCRTGFA